MSGFPPHLYYMAPLCPNAALIYLNGILPYNIVRSTPTASAAVPSIADPTINHRRHKLLVDGKSLHDFVPLYWATRTPMQYVILRDGLIRREDLVFFVCDSARVLALPGVLTTDGNAASPDTTFYHGFSGIDAVDWRIVDTPDAWSREYRRKKAAEVLVPERVPPACIAHVCVSCDESRHRLLELVGAPRTITRPPRRRKTLAIDIRVDLDLY